MSGLCGSDTFGGLAILRADLIGDANCDWRITLTDINPFILALYGSNEYYREYPDCNWRNADYNDDGNVTFTDINPFVKLLSGGKSASVRARRCFQ